MDSHQSGIKRELDVTSIQNQDDDNVSCTREEDGNCVKTKRFKQEQNELHPLQMAKVLEILFTYLNVESTKTARQVDKLWSFVGAKSLLTKCYVKLPSDLQIKKFNKKKNKQKKVNEFKSFLLSKLSDDSSIPNITIDKIGDLNVWESFGVLTPQLKSVKLTCMNKHGEFFQVFNILPNLNHLWLKELGYKPKAIKALTTIMNRAKKDRTPLIIAFMTLQPKTMELEGIEKFSNCTRIMLTELNFDLSDFPSLLPEVKDRVVNIIKKILLTSKNVLKNLSFTDIGFKTEILKVLTTVMSTASSNRKPLVITQITLEPENLNKLEDIDKFSNCKNMTIEELKLEIKPNFFYGVPNADVKVSRIISKLLSTSRNVLKKLILHNRQLVLSLLEFPCMTALTHLDLNFYMEIAGPISRCKFSPAFQFSEKVPNLQEISVDYTTAPGVSNTREFLQNLFKSAESALSVKRARCTGHYSNFSVHPLFKAFPNIEGLETCVTWGSVTRFQDIWTLGKNLKKLTLHIDLLPFTGTVPDLDSSFIGFSHDTVEKMKKTPKLYPFTPEEIEVLKADSSILNLKDLEHLTIHFHASNSSQCRLPDRLLLTAANHAFRLLPKHPEIFILVEGNTNGFMQALYDVSKLPNVTVKGYNFRLRSSDGGQSW